MLAYRRAVQESRNTSNTKTISLVHKIKEERNRGMIYLSTEVTIGDSYINENVYFGYQECDKTFGGDSIVKELRNRPNGIPIRMTKTFDLDEPWGDDRFDEHKEKIDHDLDILATQAKVRNSLVVLHWTGIEEQRSILRESAPKTFKYFNDKFEDIIHKNMPRV